MKPEHGRINLLGEPQLKHGPLLTPLSLPLFSTSALTQSLHSLQPQTSNSVPAFFGIAPFQTEQVFGVSVWAQSAGRVIPLSFLLTDTNADKPEEETEEDKNSPDCGDARGGVEMSHSGAPAGVCAPISEASD